MQNLELSWMLKRKHNVTSYLLLLLDSYEDWGVDELIVEDSWKRQVGGD